MLKHKEYREKIKITPTQGDVITIEKINTWNGNGENHQGAIYINTTGIIKVRNQEWRDSWSFCCGNDFRESLERALRAILFHINAWSRNDKKIESTIDVTDFLTLGWIKDGANYSGYMLFKRGEERMHFTFRDLPHMQELRDATYRLESA